MIMNFLTFVLFLLIVVDISRMNFQLSDFNSLRSIMILNGGWIKSESDRKKRRNGNLTNREKFSELSNTYLWWCCLV